MKEIITELIKLIKKYLYDGWALLTTAWYLIKVDELSKLNQLLITVYLLFLYLNKILSRYGHKLKKIPLLKKVINDKQIKNLSVIENNNYLNDQTDRTLDSIEKIGKEGREDMKNFLGIVGKVLNYLFRVNLFTNTGNVILIYVYYEYVRTMFEKNNYVFNQHVYIKLGIYTAILILGLIAVNGKGLESFTEWYKRKDMKWLRTLVDKLVGLDVGMNTHVISKSLLVAYNLLERLKVFIREEEYRDLKEILDGVKYKLNTYEAQKAIEKRKYEEELINLYANQQPPRNLSVTNDRAEEHLDNIPFDGQSNRYMHRKE